MRFSPVWLALSILAIAVWAAGPQFTEGKLHGRQAYILNNGIVQVSALRGAGHIAEFRFVGGEGPRAVNPMRVPHYPTIDPMDFDPAKHDVLYGGGTNRRLMAGYMGHLLNFPTFGGPSEAEAEAGLGNHGEALAVAWEKKKAGTDDGAVVLTYEAHLPKTQYNVGRTLTLPAGETVLYIEEWVENLAAYDRPAHWVQHATFGPPFVEAGKTVLEMPGTRGEIRGKKDASNTLAPGLIEWPAATSYEGGTVDLRTMQPKDRAGTYYGVLMDPEREWSYFTMHHPDYPVLIGYVWRTGDFPWVGDWQENHRNTIAPWQGKVVARGIEFGTTPFGGPMEQVVKEGPLFGVPQYRWIKAREKPVAKYLSFLLEIPTAFPGVQDVEVREGQLVVVERETGKRHEIKASRLKP